MSGFALAFGTRASVSAQDKAFTALKASVAAYKQLDPAASCQAEMQQGLAVKFDTPSSLHRGITVDAGSGSWLFAIGTVLHPEHNSEDGNLKWLLENYLNRGDIVFQELDGHFALVLYDSPHDRLRILSDPFGFVSVFVAERNGYIYVATSALGVAQAVHATPNEYGIYLFLLTGDVYGRATLWQEVERLSAGTVLDLTASGLSRCVYWTPTVNDELGSLSIKDSLAYAKHTLSQLFARYMAREGKFWADLTGGFDSRLVTTLLYANAIPFTACCAGAKTSSDVRISSRIARAMDWKYQHNILPEDWGTRRCEWLERALGKTDAHLDVFKSASVIWDQEQRARDYTLSVWGLGGELWRGTIWKQEFFNIGKTAVVNYDRLVDYRYISPVPHTVFRDRSKPQWLRAELKALFKSVGDRYIDYPNTTQLDCIFAYEATGHTGAHISAVMGQQRVLAPLYFKESMTTAISIYYKWRMQNRLVSHLIEALSPVVASFETATGGPALPVRVNNFYRFFPYWSLLTKQLLRKASHQLLGRNILSAPANPTTAYPQIYPAMQWRRQTLDFLAHKRLFNYDAMHSGALYDAQCLSDFLVQARSASFKHGAFLSRILTVEMALRAVDVAL